jgi:hypothetical protein
VKPTLRRCNDGGGIVWVAVLLCVSTFAYSADDPPGTGDSDWYRLIATGEPSLPNRPPRRENISDDEVREVQSAALAVYPDFIVVISGVTEGCDCEEGDQCTAQVGLALNRDNQSRSLVLSKIDGHWKLGAVQSWWLRYHAEHTDFPRSSSREQFHAWQQKERRLLEGFPACPAPTGHWSALRALTYVDISSIKETGHVRRANFKNVSGPSQQIRNFPSLRYSISVEAFDCRDRRTRTDSVMHYLDDGTAIRGSVIDPVLWNPIRPGTVSAANLDLVCNWKDKP